MSATKTKVEITSENGEELGQVSVSLARPARSKATAIISHGAGGTMDTPSIVGVQKQLAANGITAVRFNFLYSEKKKRSPDRQPALVATWRSVADWVKKEVKPKKLFLSGRSMGGRMASYLVAEGYPCDGVFFLAYPLHPPGKPERLRDAHLKGLITPTLFCSGDRDAFGSVDEMKELANAMPNAQHHVLTGADHGFSVRKSDGRTREEVWEEATTTLIAWLGGLA